jgi:carbonic anhydrase
MIRARREGPVGPHPVVWTSGVDDASLWTRGSVAPVTSSSANGPRDHARPDLPDFDDLLAANRDYAATHQLAGFDGVARAGVAMVTCMDSRIDPLGMIGLRPGDAKILRNAGGRVSDATLLALVVGVHLLGVRRILVVQHTRCAMASATETELHDRLSAATGRDTSWLSIEVIADQVATLRADVARIRDHPLIDSGVAAAGFVYDVDTGLLDPVA